MLVAEEDEKPRERRAGVDVLAMRKCSMRAQDRGSNEAALLFSLLPLVLSKTSCLIFLIIFKIIQQT